MSHIFVLHLASFKFEQTIRKETGRHRQSVNHYEPINFSYKINHVLLPTHADDWCISGMTYSDTGL